MMGEVKSTLIDAQPYLKFIDLSEASLKKETTYFLVHLGLRKFPKNLLNSWKLMFYQVSFCLNYPFEAAII